MFNAEASKKARFTPSSKIHSITFYVKGNNEITDESYVNVSNKNSYRGNEPVPRGLQDSHMGPTNDQFRCPTCLNKKDTCPGHFGLVELKYPVKNPLFMFTNRLMTWLKAFCFECGQTVVRAQIKAKKSKLLKEYANAAKNVKHCQHCGADHPNVVRDPKEPLMINKEYYADKKFIKREPFYNHSIWDALKRISNDSVVNIGRPLTSHPKKLIIDRIQVPTNPMRPDSKKAAGGRISHNDLTKIMRNIVAINETLPTTVPDLDRLDSEARSELTKSYIKLDSYVYDLIKGSGKKRAGDAGNKPMMSIADHWPRKDGRARQHLTARRCNHMTRSVITEDNLLRPDEVGVPVTIAKELTVPIAVQPWNRHILTQYFLNREKYPGCKGIIKKSNGKKYTMNKIQPDYELQDGDIVERHLIEGDIMGFGRQPSLLFSSIGGHIVKILNRGATLRLNISSCKYYNADFKRSPLKSTDSSHAWALVF